MKPIQRRKLLRAIAEKKKPLPSTDAQTIVEEIHVIDSGNAALPMDIEATPAISSPVHSSNEFEAPGPDDSQCCDTASGLSVRYVHCQNLFTYQAEEKVLHNVPPTTTLGELVCLIASAEGLTKDKTVELFFKEGYPLDPNEITLKGDYINNFVLLVSLVR